MSIRKLYREIAKKNGVSVAEVKRELQAAIAATYQNPKAAALAIPRKDDVPTPEEFISHVARGVSAESGNLCEHGGGRRHQAKA